MPSLEDDAIECVILFSCRLSEVHTGPRAVRRSIVVHHRGSIMQLCIMFASRSYLTIGDSPCLDSREPDFSITIL